MYGLRRYNKHKIRIRNQLYLLPIQLVVAKLLSPVSDSKDIIGIFPLEEKSKANQVLLCVCVHKSDMYMYMCRCVTIQPGRIP